MLENMYLLIFLFFLLVFVGIYLNIQRYKSLNSIPGPSWIETFQFLFVSKRNRDIYQYITKLPYRYGPVSKLWLKPFKPILIVADPKLVEQVLNSKERVYKTGAYDLLHYAGGNGLATNPDVVSWRHERKLLSPAFSKQSISQYVLSFTSHVDKIKREIELNEGKAIDVQDVLHRFTLGLVLEYLIEENVDENQNNQMVDAVDKYLDIYLQRAYSSYKKYDVIFRFLSDYGEWIKSGQCIDKIARDMLSQLGETRRNRKDLNGRKNFMDLLFQSGLHTDSIRSHLKTFIIAGYDTTATALSFSLFEISKRPDVQEKIYEEYLSAVGEEPDSAISYDDLQKMTYTEQVIRETLRMYPPVPIIQRKLMTPLIIDNVTIPDGVDLVFSIPSLHNLQFEQPDKFDPDRFSAENLKKLPSYGYAPFSIGPRDCIGKTIAMVEMKFLLAYIIKNFTLHAVVPEHKPDIIGTMVMKSDNGVLVIFRKRM